MADKVRKKDETIKDFIASESDKKERAKLKAKELSKEKLSKFTKRGIEIDILEQPTYEMDCVKVSIQVTKDGKVLPFSNPLYIFNPPILVPDGTFTTVYDEFIDKDIQIPNFEENPQEALMEHITQVVESQIKKGKYGNI